MKSKKSGIIKLPAVFLVFVTLAVVYVVNRAIPFMMDDEWYSRKLFSEELLSSVGDIIEFQIWHYHNWGGRTITHTILQLTLMAGEPIADILNVVALVLLAGMICLLSGIKRTDRKWWAMLAAVSMIIGLNANWKMSMFWQAGAANYLYITIFILGFLYCYLRELPEGTSRHLPGITLWMLPLGLIAGWSNENMGPAVWVISLLVILLTIKDKKTVKPWMILGNLSCLAGSVLMITAPGNFVRSAEVASNEYGVLWNCFLRCYAESKAALDYLFPVLLVFVAVLFLYKGIFGKAIGRKNGLLLVCALLSWGAMLLSPHYPDRATFGTMVLLICVILSMAKEILREKSRLDLWFFGGTVLIWLRGMYFLGEFLAISWGWIK